MTFLLCKNWKGDLCLYWTIDIILKSFYICLPHVQNKVGWSIFKKSFYFIFLPSFTINLLLAVAVYLKRCLLFSWENNICSRFFVWVCMLSLCLPVFLKQLVRSNLLSSPLTKAQAFKPRGRWSDFLCAVQWCMFK